MSQRRRGAVLRPRGCRGECFFHPRHSPDLRRLPRGEKGKGTITELDHHKLFEPITKWSSFLKQTAKIPETLRRAFRIATTGRPGAVHLAFPQETLLAELPKDNSDLYGESDCTSYPAYRTRGSGEVLGGGRGTSSGGRTACDHCGRRSQPFSIRS